MFDCHPNIYIIPNCCPHDKQQYIGRLQVLSYGDKITPISENLSDDLVYLVQCNNNIRGIHNL